ncbi:MFS transporter [Saprospira grandis]|uniref:Major facilitator superfamily protein n=1 Tax=Saprospira grandis (strain Lewin) TaxID=984262 RepID=H6L8F1_SAPGL|nr:MFS transporter [Saprospira grandis]AFC26515.1 major facilitator superfamily protein [Saprospira grandis str. Lewin]
MENLKLGLRANAYQFALLVFVNALVGALLGLERSVFGSYVEACFGILAEEALFYFIMAFGLAKATANYFAGLLMQLWGRKRVLLLGWALALPIPFLFAFSPAWELIVFANLLLGANQGFAWSSTVVMKIDLAGAKDRGLAMGINESAGYLSLALSAYATAAYLGPLNDLLFWGALVFVLLGLGLSAVFVRETAAYALLEQATSPPLSGEEEAASAWATFKKVSFLEASLSSVTFAGWVNNLNDGMIWGLLPILLLEHDLLPNEIGWVTALYPAVWGLGQLATGKQADKMLTKELIRRGMYMQAFAILGFAYSSDFLSFMLSSFFLGLGTALVYPSFLVAISWLSPVQKRAEYIGIFRLWRDLGYLFGALFSALLWYFFGLTACFYGISALTFFAALIVQVRMRMI